MLQGVAADPKAGKSVTFDSSVASLPVLASVASVVPSSGGKACSRCRAALENGWLFCAVCGQRSSASSKKSKSKAQAATTASTASPPKLGDEEPEQTDLKLLPAHVLAGLKTVLKGFETGKFNESHEALERKQMLLAALELESAMQLEDAYQKLNRDDKVRSVSALAFDDPRISNLPRDAVKPPVSAAMASGDFGFVYGRAEGGGSLLPSISAPKRAPVVKGAGKKSASTTTTTAAAATAAAAPVSFSSKRHPASGTGSGTGTGTGTGSGYLDEVGSVARFYAEYVERERQLVGLRRVIVDEQERALAQGLGMGSGFGAGGAGAGAAAAAGAGGIEDEAAQRRRHAEFLRMQQALLGEEGEESDEAEAAAAAAAAQRERRRESDDEEDEEQGGETRARGPFIVDGRLASPLRPTTGEDERGGGDEEEGDEKGDEQRRAEAASKGGAFWGQTKQRGRFFLPRDGVDAGHQFDVRRDQPSAALSRSLSLSLSRLAGRRAGSAASDGDGKDDEDDDGEGEEERGGALSWQQVLLEAEQLKAMQTPMLWTPVIRPKVTLGEGLAGFLDDRPLSRPLTPEPTSDDEDEKFEQQMRAMQEEREAKKAAAAAAEAAAWGGGPGAEAGAVQPGAAEAGPTSAPPPGGSLSASLASEDDDVHELDHIDPEAAAQRAALLRAEKKARVARARRQLAFDTAFANAQEQGKPKPKRYKPRAKRSEDMDEAELRAYELQKAIDAADGKQDGEGDDDDDDETLPPDPIAVRTALPAFKAYSIIARMYKRSLVELKAAVAQAEVRLVDELLPPPRSGKPLPFKRLQLKLAVVQEALAQAPGVDQQAHIEFEAFQTAVNAARAEAATKVATALEELAAFHATFNKRYAALVADKTHDPYREDKLERLKAKADEDLFPRGREVQALQAHEAAVIEDLRAQEFVTIQTVQKWRPLHAEWLGKARWARRTLQTLLHSFAAKVIQRCAKRRLLFMFWGEPSKPWSDPLADRIAERRRRRLK